MFAHTLRKTLPCVSTFFPHNFKKKCILRKNILLFSFKLSVLSQLCKRSFSVNPCSACKCLSLIPSPASAQISLLLSFPQVTAFIYLRCTGLPTIPFEVVSLHKKQASKQELLPKESERKSMALKYRD